MTDIVKGPITVPDEAPMLFAENIQLRFENERLGRDYQAARDAHDKLLAENERFKISLSDTVQQTQEQMSEITALRAENEKLRAALKEVMVWSKPHDKVHIIARAALEK